MGPSRPNELCDELRARGSGGFRRVRVAEDFVFAAIDKRYVGIDH